MTARTSSSAGSVPPSASPGRCRRRCPGSTGPPAPSPPTSTCSWTASPTTGPPCTGAPTPTWPGSSTRCSAAGRSWCHPVCPGTGCPAASRAVPDDDLPPGRDRRGRRGGHRGGRGRRRDRHHRARRRPGPGPPDHHACCRTCTCAWCAADQVVATVPDALDRIDSAPAADLDQRTVRHERHRTQPGRGRPRAPQPACDHHGVNPAIGTCRLRQGLGERPPAEQTRSLSREDGTHVPSRPGPAQRRPSPPPTARAASCVRSGPLVQCRGHHGTLLTRHNARWVRPETPSCWIHTPEPSGTT